MIKLIQEKLSDRKYYGWILYTEQECIKNQYYIEMYQKACEKYDMSIQLGIYKPEKAYFGTSYDQLESGQHKQQFLELMGRQKPVFAVNRTRDYRLAEALEAFGVRVYNNSQIAEIGNDKAKGYLYMQQHGIPIMPTVYETETAPVHYPAVVKSCSGHGGTEVFLLHNLSEWQDWKKCLYQKQKKYVVQQAASDLGKDLRVYIVGGKIAASVLRTSQRDFRSNYSLGGNVQLYELSIEQRAIVENIISKLNIGMAGIDFVFHHGRMVFNEIEDMAGARMLYMLSDYNIVDEYIQYIRKDLEHQCSV